MDVPVDRKKQFLICGDVKGKFNELFERVVAIQAKTPISVLICIGKFFGPTLDSLNPYITQEKALPILTYFMATPDEVHLLDPEIRKGGEVCKHLIHLGMFIYS